MHRWVCICFSLSLSRLWRESVFCSYEARGRRQKREEEAIVVVFCNCHLAQLPRLHNRHSARWRAAFVIFQVGASKRPGCSCSESRRVRDVDSLILLQVAGSGKGQGGAASSALIIIAALLQSPFFYDLNDF